VFRRLVLAALAFAGPALAGEVRPYDAAAFEAAEAAGAPVVIHVTASWCPTCHAQTPIVRSLADDPANPDLLVLVVDFDTEQDVLRRFGVRHQSTLIAFRGGEERARSVGDTRPAGVAALVAATR
jgi:thioredoxin 1